MGVIRRIATAFWTRSPADLAAAMSRRLRSQASPPQSADLSSYHAWLLEQVYTFVHDGFPADALEHDSFMALIGKHQDPGRLRASNRYLGDLWYLFAPDFQRRLDDYYRYQDFQLMATLLSYAANGPLVQANYVRPYDAARQRLGRFSVLELGAGVPHGFLHAVYTHGSSFCSGLTSVDIDGTPARFVKAFCERNAVPHRWIRATAGLAAALDDAGPFDFVFAKDVFEHLMDPAVALDDVLAHASERAVLALDLDDKGAAVYQHVSPALEPLKARVEQAGFAKIEHTGNISMFASA
jgi:hypothetical protein